jgi:type VI secretion system protein ImpG
MDPRLLRYYNEELQHLRQMGAEFARQFPKIAARLGIDGIEVSDPYVERLLEGTAFLAARVQLKLDAEFPRFTQRLQEMVYPNFLAPVPSMLIAQFQPQADDTNLAAGSLIPRGSAMRSRMGKGDTSVCEFRTAQDLVLWPIEIVEASYFTHAAKLPPFVVPDNRKIRGGLRIRLATTAGLRMNQIALDTLRIFFSGDSKTAFRLHELCLGRCVAILAAPPGDPPPWHIHLPGHKATPVGHDDCDALLPVSSRTFQGYRLLQEYFTLPERFLFMDLKGLGAAVRRHTGNELDIVLLFEQGDPALESLVGKDSLSLFCAPAVNLFPKRADRIHLTAASSDHHVVPDRAHPMDYEVFDVTEVIGHGARGSAERRFVPFYASCHADAAEKPAYYTVQREPRLLSEAQKKNGFRSSYVGTEVYLSLVDAAEAPYRHDLRQLSVGVRCTNRDLPLQIPLGGAQGDFILDEAAPLAAIRCMKGPSRPLSPLSQDAKAWRFINHLSLNYLSLLDTDERQGALALRQMLGLYAAASAGVQPQIDALLSVRTQAVTRRLPGDGRIAVGRGIRIEIDVDELGFQGGSAFLFGSVLDRFLARYVSINSFTETVLRSSARGEIFCGKPQWGSRPIL